MYRFCHVFSLVTMFGSFIFLFNNSKKKIQLSACYDIKIKFDIIFYKLFGSHKTWIFCIFILFAIIIILKPHFNGTLLAVLIFFYTRGQRWNVRRRRIKPLIITFNMLSRTLGPTSYIYTRQKHWNELKSVFIFFAVLIP